MAEISSVGLGETIHHCWLASWKSLEDTTFISYLLCEDNSDVVVGSLYVGHASVLTMLASRSFFCPVLLSSLSESESEPISSIVILFNGFCEKVTN